MNQIYISENTSVKIYQETSGFDIRLRFVDSQNESISFELPTSGNISPKTFFALYGILIGTQYKVSGVISGVISASRITEIGKTLGVSIDNNIVRITASDNTKGQKNEINVQFEATEGQIGQFHNLILAIMDDNSHYSLER